MAIKEITGSSLQFLEKLPPKQFKQVALRVLELANNPFPHDCRPLYGNLKGYRLDQGEYRILYTVNEEKDIVIYKIGHRKDVYR
jgi:mRNA interferase RelE/StbE